MGRGWLRQWVTTDHFYMSVGADDLDFGAALSSAGNGSLEIGGHPGTVDAWRVGETTALRQLAATLRANGYQVVAWRDL
jgi:hypothetical protein